MRWQKNDGKYEVESKCIEMKISKCIETRLMLLFRYDGIITTENTGLHQEG